MNSCISYKQRCVPQVLDTSVGLLDTRAVSQGGVWRLSSAAPVDISRTQVAR